MTPADPPLEQVKGLQRCINDLVTLLAFPAMWAGRSPAHIVSSFAEGLLRILNLDAVYVRVTAEAGASSECFRAAQAAHLQLGLAPELFACFDGDPAKWPQQMTVGSDGHVLAIQPLRLGLHAQLGTVVAGSLRAPFPLQTEQLLMNVAANQLVVALQEAQLRIEQQRVAEELDRRVAERTAELAASNDELRREIAERRHMETRLRKSERATSLGVLTAAIAHEVNQPISGIITNANTCVRMLSAGSPDINGALETARRTIRDANRALDVITRLRTLYIKRDIQPEPMDLNEAADEVVSLSLTELQRNGVILRQDLAQHLPIVRGDRIQLQQVILNLLRNAADAMSTIEDRPRELLIRTEPDDHNRVRLSVKDAGIGLAAEAARRIFEPFYTTKTDGMGIGLSVSRSIIEAHGGNLWATPNEGPGATVAFDLPRAGHSQRLTNTVTNT